MEKNPFGILQDIFVFGGLKLTESYSLTYCVSFINLDCHNLAIFLYSILLLWLNCYSTEELCIWEYLCQLYWAPVHCTILQTLIFVTFQFLSKIAGLVLYCSICHSLVACAIQTGRVYLRKKGENTLKGWKTFNLLFLPFWFQKDNLDIPLETL